MTQRSYSSLTRAPRVSYPDDNRQVLLQVRPTGIPQPEHFEIVQTARPAPNDGEFLVRNLYLSVDPAQRGWASAEANYSAPVPLGAPMRALAVSEVVESRHADFKAGDYLYGWFDWQDYCVAGPGKVLRRVDPAAAPLSVHAGLLGISGLAAYLAFKTLCRPESGDRILVSTAAGSVGSLVGQIARIKGCHAMGLTGSDDKVRLCLEDYGYEVALNYKKGVTAEALRAFAPTGFDIYFDNVGGDILDLALRQMAIGGRVVQCGTASVASWTPPPMGLRNEREVLSRRLTWSGFVIFDHAARFDHAADELATWFRDGSIHLREEIETDIEGAPDAIRALYAGVNVGKKLIYIG
jgi:hypothetical protein